VKRDDERMKGAIVFLIVFAVAVVITLGNTAIPPGKAARAMSNPFDLRLVLVYSKSHLSIKSDSLNKRFSP